MINSPEQVVDQLRHELLEKIERASPGEESLKLIASLRRMELTTPGYSNALNILSDTTYESRKHFILELIQNADDATFSVENAGLEFVINNDNIVLSYNEDGFSKADVMSITDTGSSNKIGKVKSSNSYIGEKGIGFKSVFALAEAVEIASPPWHFKLEKNKCIVPEVMPNLEGIKGTYLKLTFENKDVVEEIAKELFKYFSSEVETFLFLQELTVFILKDNRTYPAKVFKVSISPINRKGDRLSVKIEPGNEVREYVLYSEEHEFPKSLVKERWEKAGDEIDSIKRKFIAAAIIKNGNHKINNGKLFCFLPSEVSLPLPINLQIDGHMTADRGRLHEPSTNRWNKYLIERLPDFLLKSILSWRRMPVVSDHLLEYIPNEFGNGQLANVFCLLKEKLIDSEWVKTNDNEWVSPKNAIIPNDLFLKLFHSIPGYREEVENFIKKKFVSNEWLCSSACIGKLRDYKVSLSDGYMTSLVLRNISISHAYLSDDDSLRDLYEEIISFEEFKSSFWGSKLEEIKANISYAPIFPMEGEGFAPLFKKIDGQKVFYLSTTARREIGIDQSTGFKCRFLNPEYTRKNEPGGSATEQYKEKMRQLNKRNDALKSLLGKLNIDELNEENLLSEVQIPFLKDPSYRRSHKMRVLMAIFEAFSSKKTNDDDYNLILSGICEAEFEASDGSLAKLRELRLPQELQISPDDSIFNNTSIKSIKIDPQFLAQYNLENLRRFLIICGIKTVPSFEEVETLYLTCTDFEMKDPLKYDKWSIKVPNPSMGVRITVTESIVDKYSIELLHKDEKNRDCISDAIYKVWKTKYASSIKDVKKGNIGTIIPPGYFSAHYRYSIQIYKDDCWAGVPKDRFLLRDANQNSAGPKKVYSIDESKCYPLVTASKLLHLVIACDADSDRGYDRDYLESLGVKEVKLSALNSLWESLDETQHSDILRAALELLNIGTADDGLLLLDKNSGQLKAAKEFRRGIGENSKYPMIEIQYGKIGYELGIKLNLQVVNDVSSFENIFDILFNCNGEKNSDTTDKLYILFKSWHGWNPAYKNEIIQAFEKSFSYFEDELNNLKPMVIFNGRDIAEKLIRSKKKVICIDAPEIDLYTIESAAKEIGFDIYSETGKLICSDEIPLVKQDREVLVLLAEAYYENLADYEKSKFKLKLMFFGDIRTWPDKIVRVKKVERVIDEALDVRISQDIPYLGRETNRLIISYDYTPEKALAALLSASDFTIFRSALRDIDEFKDHIYQNVLSNLAMVPVAEVKQRAATVNETLSGIAKGILDSMIDYRRAAESIGVSEWNTGMSPEEEQAFH